MSNSILTSNIFIALNATGVSNPAGYKNVGMTELLDKLKAPDIGNKDGSHFLRTTLQLNDDGICLPRTDKNTASLANVLILDCDKSIDENGVISEGAPNPQKVSEILKDQGVNHILYGSYSHYTGDKGHRFRILVFTERYTKQQLAWNVDRLVSLINAGLNDALLANAKENCAWSQAWYCPRKPKNSSVPDLYIEYSDGENFPIEEPVLPPSTVATRQTTQLTTGQISPIDAYNQQFSLKDLLKQYGYKFVCSSIENERWLMPESTSGIAGIIVKGQKFYSHHGTSFFNDGHWHDAFDLMRHHEGLAQNEAIIKAAQQTVSPTGETVDAHNKSVNRKTKDITPKNQSIIHTEILNRLLCSVKHVDFWQAANLKTGDKFKSSYYQVIIIEKILALAKEHKWDMCSHNGGIYLYNGSYWDLIEEGDLKNFLGQAAEKMGVKHLVSRHFNFKDLLFKQFLSAAHLSIAATSEDAVCINLKNGTFLISSTENKLVNFDAKHFLTYQLPFAYDPDAKAPMFEAYLKRVLPNEELHKVLAEYLGYVFIKPSVLKMEKVLLLYGQGANGKSVFYEVTSKLFGEENTSEYSLESLTNTCGYQRAMIGNKLVNYATEISGRQNIADFKKLASGEPVEARLPYGKPFIMKNYAKLIFNCNALPKDVEHNSAFYRRLIIVPFNETIPEHEQDKQLAQKIITGELAGIFNWVLEGLKRLLANKHFTECDEINEAKAEYQLQSDNVNLFLEDKCYVPDPKGRITLDNLYYEYQVYCQSSGYYPVNKTNFSQRLKNLGVHVPRHGIGRVAYLIINNQLSSNVINFNKHTLV